MSDQTYLDQVIALTEQQQRIYAAAWAGEDVDPALFDTVEQQLAAAWERRRCEKLNCTTEPPGSLQQDRKGLHSIQIKAERVGRAVFVQADT